MSFCVNSMARPSLARCLQRLEWKRQVKSFHCSSRRHASPQTIANLFAVAPADSTVTVNGFIRTIRNQKKRSFASIGDGSSLEPLQALLTPAQAESLSTGTAVRVTGKWVVSPNPKQQSHELIVDDVVVIGTADPATFPLQKKYHTPEYLRSMPHLRTRTPLNSTLLRLRSDAIAAATASFAQAGFVQTHPPLITSSDCEGAGEVFHVGSSYKGPPSKDDDGSFFRSPKYLTVSNQLHLEALSQSVGNVWTLSPTFRAERSDTSRHLSEFYMLEAEVSFVEDMQRVMEVVKTLIQDITMNLASSRVGNELLYGRGIHDSDQTLSSEGELLRRRWEKIGAEWGHITYTEAIAILTTSTQKFEHLPTWGAGLQAEHERYIANTVADGAPVFVTHYPKSIKPFYMLSSNTASSQGETVDCFDLIVPEACEIVGGSMREHRLEPLMKAMQASKLLPPGPIDPDDRVSDLDWYLDLRRWGSVPHGGFGLGFDRLLGYLAGVPNIREVVTFPRWMGRCDC